MPTLLMLSGLPGSGKTTVARRLVDEKGYARINRDDLRAMLFNSEWTGRREKHVVEIEKSLAAYFLAAGQNVVVDDTNVTQSHLDMWRDHARRCGAEFSVQKMDTPMSECIERDSKRLVGHVGRRVIEDMALRAGIGDGSRIAPNLGREEGE